MKARLLIIIGVESLLALLEPLLKVADGRNGLMIQRLLVFAAGHQRLPFIES